MTETGTNDINNFTDDVLCHILSFLATKDAVATSVLSKRFRSLWLYTPSINFTQSNEDIGSWVVYSVMRMKGLKLPLKRFCLKLNGPIYDADSFDISTWVNGAIQRRLEYLDLSLSLSLDINFPLGNIIHGSKTLVVLKLNKLKVDNVFIDGFPCLKTMHLDNVVFKQHKHLMHLLSGCPNLEELHAIKPVTEDGYTFNADNEDFEFQSLHNLALVTLSMADCIPMECIPQVKFLSFKEDFSFFQASPDYKFTCMFRNLSFLKFIVKVYNMNWFLQVLQHCPNLQSLVILKDANVSDHYMDENIDVKKWQPELTPECLSTQLNLCSFQNFRGWKCELEFAKYIMKNAKVLQNMRISSHRSSKPQTKLEMVKKLSLCPKSSPTCELSFE
ncbi:hypothetical protein Lal_00009291 [Lupinus albus]|nr:hypothetical protein Lal_00009291 [Lupinus albus]